MLENVKAVKNPLTIIWIFAALAEIAATIAIGLVDKSHHGTFIWFVMGFPVFLVSLFFLTLNFNAKVLYAPSDFKDEENFLDTFVGTRKVSMDLDRVTKQLDTVKDEIVALAREKATADTKAQNEQLAAAVEEQLASLRKNLVGVRKEAAVVASAAPFRETTGRWIERVMVFLREAGPLQLSELEARTGLSAQILLRTINELNAAGLVELTHPHASGPTRFALTDSGHDMLSLGPHM